jgi:16S rRNA (adenine1518-N6/adenine1519-N6)-dimethyltransferase
MANGNRVKPPMPTTEKDESARKRKNGAPVPKPRKPKLGQNFLTDRSAAERIVDALGDISQSTVLEIGPGRGAITDLLQKRARRLIAIELDRVLAAQLRMKFATARNIEIIEADVLAVDFDTIMGPRPGSTFTGLASPTIERAKVVGNIPYYITSEILLRLFDFHRYFEEMVIMVQAEVADRVAAKPGTSDYGLLSATAQLYTKPEKLFTLPPAAFNPPPKVHSTVLRLVPEPRVEELGVNPDQFVDFLKLSFGQKRKTLANNLKARYDEKAIKAALSAAKVRADARAEALPLEKAAAIFRSLSQE